MFGLFKKRRGKESTPTSSSEDFGLSFAAAMDRARRELPGVLQRFQAGELEGAGFSVKVPVRDGEQLEYFWLADTSYAEGCFSGFIEDEPVEVSTVKLGDRWTALAQDVVDWMYSRDEKMHGNFTLRAVLGQMAPEHAGRYRALLAD